MGKNVMTSEPADTAWISGLLDQGRGLYHRNLKTVRYRLRDRTV